MSECCKHPDCGELGDWDGYCMGHWPGYQSCANPECGHYRCEHNITFGKAVYVAPGAECFADSLEGLHISGCANADCHCEKFEEKPR